MDLVPEEKLFWLPPTATHRADAGARYERQMDYPVSTARWGAYPAVRKRQFPRVRKYIGRARPVLCFLGRKQGNSQGETYARRSFCHSPLPQSPMSRSLRPNAGGRCPKRLLERRRRGASDDGCEQRRQYRQDRALQGQSGAACRSTVGNAAIHRIPTNFFYIIDGTVDIRTAAHCSTQGQSQQSHPYGRHENRWRQTACGFPRVTFTSCR